MKEEYKKIIEDSINTIEESDIKRLAWHLAETLPEYIWRVGASSTGKYHPEYTLGDGGLMRHMIAALKLLNHFLSIDQYKNKFSSRERDLLRVAMLFHDGRKSGSQSDYEMSKYTKFNHPILMADSVMTCGNFLPRNELMFIALAISSHMGQWNTGKNDEVLPLPVTDSQQLIHLADYLASRKDITVSVSRAGEAHQEEQPQEKVARFGKYVGQKWTDIKKQDPQYVDWLLRNFTTLDEETKSYLKSI